MRNRRAQAFDEQAQAAEIAGAASAEAAYLAVHEDEPPLAPGADLTAAAFFDVDNTMMQGASIFHFARGLVARDFFTTGDLLDFALLQIKFRIAGEDADDMSRSREGALAFVAGRQVSEIVELGEEIYDELMADKIYPRYPGAGAAAPGRRSAGVAGDGHAGGAGADHRPPARPDRRARHRRRAARTASTPAGSSVSCCTARRRRPRSGRWPPARVSTCVGAPPTRIR